jgi:hypothetical protein
MAAIQIQPPRFFLPGTFASPSTDSAPVASGASFKEDDFLIFGTAGPPPSSNQSLVAPPPQPSVSFDVAAGAVANGTYRVVTTYVTPFGESLASPEGVVTISGGPGEINVQSPPIVPGVTGYNVYVTAAAGASGTETKQVTVPASPVPIGTQAQNRATGVGAAPPVANTTGGPAPLIAAGAAANTANATLPAGSYFGKFTYVYQSGEGAVGPESLAVAVVGPNNSIVWTTPAAQAGATGYNIYTTGPGGASGTELKQNAAPIAIGTNFTQTSLAAPGLAKAASNQSGGIVGLAEHDSGSNYAGFLGGSAAVATRAAASTQLLGAQAGPMGTIMPPDIANAKYVKAAGGMEWEISLPSTYTYPGFSGGQQFGLGIDATTGWFVADPTLSNLIFNFVEEANGPNRGTVGDTGKRIRVQLAVGKSAF